MHIPADESALADLQKLDNELRARGLQARLVTPEGRLPYLAVHEPHAPASAERVYAQADSCFWPR